MTTWHAIIVVGSEKALRGFVAGFASGRPKEDLVLFGRDTGVQASSFGAMLHDLFSGGSHQLLLAPAPVADALAAALEGTGRDADLRIESRRAVLGASFEFKAEAFSPEVAETIEAAMHRSLPPDVVIDAFKEEEETDGEARGAELYSPAHDYTYRAAGRVHGALPGVLEVFRRAKNIEFVEAEPVAIATAEPTKR